MELAYTDILAYRALLAAPTKSAVHATQATQGYSRRFLNARPKLHASYKCDQAATQAALGAWSTMLGNEDSKKHRVRTMPASLLPGERKERLVAMAAEAREKLKPWALQPVSGVSTFNRLYMALGEQEGVGGLLHIASLGADGGDVSEEQIDAFLQRSDAFFDGVLHTVNQFAIVAALVFTISVPLAVYNLDGIETFGTREAALGGDGSPVWYRAWHGPRAQHACHWMSCLLISLSVYCSWEAISRCFMIIPCYSLYMPDMEARLRFFMLHYDRIMYVWPYTWGSGCLLLLALPFLGARMSPVISMCTAIPAVGAIRMTKSTCWKWGNMSGDFQHELAKQLLAADGSSQGEDRAGENVS